MVSNENLFLLKELHHLRLVNQLLLDELYILRKKNNIIMDNQTHLSSDGSSHCRKPMLENQNSPDIESDDSTLGYVSYNLPFPSKSSPLLLKPTRAVTGETPKSTSGTVWTFLRGVDLAISFVFPHPSKKNIIKISKGAKIVLGQNRLTVNEWENLEALSLREGNCMYEIRKTPNIPLILIMNSNRSGNCINRLVNVLDYCNMSLANEYPLRVGIDEFEKAGCQFDPLAILQIIERSCNLYFYFYSRGLYDFRYVEIDGKGVQGFMKGNSRLINFINSMVEIKNITALEDVTLIKEYSSYLKDLLMGARKHEMVGFLKVKGFNIYDNEKGKLLFNSDLIVQSPDGGSNCRKLSLENQNKSDIESGERTFEYGFGFSLEHGGCIVPFDPSINRFSTIEKLVLVSKKTKIRLNTPILEQMKKVIISNVDLPDIQWIAGVPGAGKTVFILNEHRPGKDLVLSLTREGCMSLREKMMVKHRMSVLDAKKFYRTVASLLVNGCSCKFERVFIDEALLMHAGTVGFVTAITGASTIILVGDEWQIPYIDREKVSNLDFGSPKLFANVTTTLTCSRRCPVDVCFALSQFYPGIHSTNPVILSMSTAAVSDQVLLDKPNTLFLAHTQEEKEALKVLGLGRLTGSNVLSIHEAQGLTFKNVILVRFNKRRMPIYDSIEHAIVAISRHTQFFCYVNSGQTDMVTSLMRHVGLCKVGLPNWNNQQKIRHSLGLTTENLIKGKGSAKNGD